jgi:hypothetical protein
MKRLVLLTTLVFALMAAIPAVSIGGNTVGTLDSCAASFGVEDAQACGSGGGSIVAIWPCTYVPQWGGWFTEWYNRNTGERWISRCYP